MTHFIGETTDYIIDLTGDSPILPSSPIELLSDDSAAMGTASGDTGSQSSTETPSVTPLLGITASPSSPHYAVAIDIGAKNFAYVVGSLEGKTIVDMKLTSIEDILDDNAVAHPEVVSTAKWVATAMGAFVSSMQQLYGPVLFLVEEQMKNNSGRRTAPAHTFAINCMLETAIWTACHTAGVPIEGIMPQDTKMGGLIYTTGDNKKAKTKEAVKALSTGRGPLAGLGFKILSRGVRAWLVTPSGQRQHLADACVMFTAYGWRKSSLD